MILKVEILIQRQVNQEGGFNAGDKMNPFFKEPGALNKRRCGDAQGIQLHDTRCHQYLMGPRVGKEKTDKSPYAFIGGNRLNALVPESHDTAHSGSHTFVTHRYCRQPTEFVFPDGWRQTA